MTIVSAVVYPGVRIEAINLFRADALVRHGENEIHLSALVEGPALESIVLVDWIEELPSISRKRGSELNLAMRFVIASPQSCDELIVVR